MIARMTATHSDQTATGKKEAQAVLPTRTLPSKNSINHSQPRRTPQTFEPHMLVIFALVFVTALAFFAAMRLGTDYYLTVLAERPQHPQHENFKASGLIGQGLGGLGGLFCLLTLLYPLRKRWRALENLGTPRTWFQFHVYFGIAGPLFATLHTTFKFGGLASISYWSMMIVMASGFVGRFLFALLPRNQRGVAMSLQEIEAEIRVVQQYFEARGLPHESFESAAGVEKLEESWRLLFRLWRERRRELRGWSRQLRNAGLSQKAARRLLPLLARKLFLESSRITLAATTRAFSYWHVLHLPFTYLMFLTLLLHVGLAIFLGYTWIF